MSEVRQVHHPKVGFLPRSHLLLADLSSELVVQIRVESTRGRGHLREVNDGRESVLFRSYVFRF